MNTYKRHRFPPDIISYAVWLLSTLNDLGAAERRLARGAREDDIVHLAGAHCRRSVNLRLDEKISDGVGRNAAVTQQEPVATSARRLRTTNPANLRGEQFDAETKQ